MAIQVTCPGCHARFKVSDKFAGQKGPCPKCKEVIEIPSADEAVVVHAPEEFGPKGVSGKAVFKPIEREHTKFSPLITGIIGAASLVVVIIAIVLRSSGGAPGIILALGSILLGPPLAMGGYLFLREDELEPYDGKELYVRALVCGLIYALMWGIYAFIPTYLALWPLEVFTLVFIAPPLVAAGGAAGMFCFDSEYTTGLLNCGLYVVVTVILSFIIGVPLMGTAV